MPRLVPYVLALLICALVPAGAAAAPTIDGIFPTGPTPLSGKPGYLTLGPDGNIWVVLGSKVARVTPQGDVTEFDPNGIGNMVGITAGPDGNLWVTADGNVGKFSTADPLTGTLYTIASANRANISISASSASSCSISSSCRRNVMLRNSASFCLASSTSVRFSSSHISPPKQVL